MGYGDVQWGQLVSPITSAADTEEHYRVALGWRSATDKISPHRTYDS